MSLKAFVVRDASLSDELDLAYLLYYETSGRFIIELNPSVGEWDMPPILSSFLRRGTMTVDHYWSRIWVEQRIIPPDRQNLGMILKEFHLKEYDPFSLLMIAKGKCSQDDCYLMPLKENAFPDELKERLRHKIRDVFKTSEDRILLAYFDGTVLPVEKTVLESENSRLARLLSYHKGLSGLKLSPGGHGLEWNEDQYITEEQLRKAAGSGQVTFSDILIFVKNNLISTGEAAAMLDCSRQNINDLVRRKKLFPVRKEGNNSLFLRSDIAAESDRRGLRKSIHKTVT